MKKLVIFLFIAAFGKLSAQTDTLKLSLNQAMQLGIINRFDVKANRMDIDIAKNNLLKSKKELLPELTVNGKLTYYGQIQPSIIPAGYLGFTEPKKIAIGMKNNTALSMDMNYTIYKPGLYTDLKIFSNNIELEKEKNNQSDLDIKIEIAVAYDDILLASLQYEIARKNESRYKEYYGLAQGKYDNGALLESELFLAELDYKNSEANTVKLKQNYLLSIQKLRNRIMIPWQSVIVLTDSLLSFSTADAPAGVSSGAVANRSEIKQLTIQQAVYLLQLKKAKQSYLPTLSLFANYTQFFQGPELDYANSFYWAPVNYIGIKLSIPITGSLKNINSVNECKLASAQLALNLKQKTADMLYEAEETTTELFNAKQNLAVAKDNYLLSQKVYELKKQQYNSGSFSYEKLLDTEKSFSAAEQEYITAVYAYQVATINYHKALGDF